MTTLPSRFGVEPRQTVEREVLQVEDVKAALANASDVLCSELSNRYFADRLSPFELAELDARLLDCLQEAIQNFEVRR